MLSVNQLAKRYGDDLIFEKVSFIVNRGDRLGLIGPNGCGKTTLLRIIVGEDSANYGSVSFTPPNLRVGYLPQGLEPPPDARVGDVLFPQVNDLKQLEDELERLGDSLAASPQDSVVMTAYSDTLDAIERLANMVQPDASAPILAGLGLDHLDLDDQVGILSGGQKTRLGLARLLVADPQLLILDEPTNHLDIGALEWLEGWLATFPGAALIVSHDRTFLDRTVNRIVAMDPVTQTSKVYAGNYTDYIDVVVKAREKHYAEWRDQEVETVRLKRDAERTMAKAQRHERNSVTDTDRRYAKKVAKRAKSKEKRLDRYLDSDDRVEKPKLSWQMKLDFVDVEAGSRDVLRLDKLAVGYDAAQPLLTDVTLTIRVGERIILTGPNGTGKTTLLRTILGDIPALSGVYRFGTSTKVGYLSQEQGTLDDYDNALDAVQSAANLSQTDARTFLHAFLFAGDAVFVPMAQLSYGERARLMLAQMVAQGCNMLVLDEPINHLDVPSREMFEQAMTAYNGTILAVVHDRYFLERFATRLWVADEGGVQVFYDLMAYQQRVMI